MFKCVGSSSAFKRCRRQGSVEALRLWQKMATQLLANVEEEWVRKIMGVLLDFEGEKAHQTCSFMLQLTSRRGATDFLLKRSSRSQDVLRISREKRTTPSKKECNPRKRPFRNIRKKEVKIFRGRSSDEDLWTTYFQFIQTLERIKGWETKTMRCLFRFNKQKKKKHGKCENKHQENSKN